MNNDLITMIIMHDLLILREVLHAAKNTGFSLLPTIQYLVS